MADLLSELVAAAASATANRWKVNTKLLDTLYTEVGNLYTSDVYWGTVTQDKLWDMPMNTCRLASVKPYRGLPFSGRCCHVVVMILVRREAIHNDPNLNCVETPAVEQRLMLRVVFNTVFELIPESACESVVASASINMLLTVTCVKYGVQSLNRVSRIIRPVANRVRPLGNRPTGSAYKRQYVRPVDVCDTDVLDMLYVGLAEVYCLSYFFGQSDEVYAALQPKQMAIVSASRGHWFEFVWRKEETGTILRNRIRYQNNHWHMDKIHTDPEHKRRGGTFYASTVVQLSRKFCERYHVTPLIMPDCYVVRPIE